MQRPGHTSGSTESVARRIGPRSSRVAFHTSLYVVSMAQGSQLRSLAAVIDDVHGPRTDHINAGDVSGSMVSGAACPYNSRPMLELGVKTLLAYLLGSLLGSLIVGQIRGGVDIRTMGSGN